MASYWFPIIVSLCIGALIKALFSLFSRSSTKKKLLPPGPVTFPVIGNLIWLRKSFFELEPILRDLRAKYGPLVTIHIGPRPAIFVASHDIAHRALVQNGAVYSSRPPPLPTSEIISSNQHNISSAPYGSTWRLFRRNLTAEILHPSRVKSFSHARRSVLNILLHHLSSSSAADAGPSTAAVRVVDHFQYAMFCLLVFMCLGDKVDDSQIKRIEEVQRGLLLSFGKFNVLNFWPRIGRVLFWKKWREFEKLRENQDEVLIPLIKSRLSAKNALEQEQGKDTVVAYVDTLADLELPEEGKRKLTDGEMVSLCSEFLNAGTDTTSTALQWIMANLVKHPQIQGKLYEEIVGVVGSPPPPPTLTAETAEKGAMAEVREEDLEGMKYLKAVVLESLRRHPPGHFVLPHSVSEEADLDGYVVPKNATVNFLVAEMGWDPKVWDEPMEFRPERFMKTSGGEGEVPLFDVSGSKEIKMMPFGAGRRVCPGSALALLHLEYFVANLIWYFEWTAAEGGVDLSEKQEFTVVMKNPLQAHLSPRAKLAA